jgi:hypothetical protein
MTTPSQSYRKHLKAESKKIVIFMSVRFRTVLSITMFKSVNDEFYILMINIVMIGIKGLLPGQCIVIHFLFTCDKAFVTNLSSTTIRDHIAYY